MTKILSFHRTLVLYKCPRLQIVFFVNDVVQLCNPSKAQNLQFLSVAPPYDRTTLKVRQSQNNFMKLLVLPKYEQKIVRISALLCSEGRYPDNFWFIYWEKLLLRRFILKLSDLQDVNFDLFNAFNCLKISKRSVQ